MELRYYLSIFLFFTLVSADTTFFEGVNREFIISEENGNIDFYCGDAICNNNESCGDCNIDCGRCKLKDFENITDLNGNILENIDNIPNDSGDMNVVLGYNYNYLLVIGLLVTIGFVVYLIVRKKI